MATVNIGTPTDADQPGHAAALASQLDGELHRNGITTCAPLPAQLDDVVAASSSNTTCCRRRRAD